MSLAKLFYLKEAFRTQVREWRHACFSNDARRSSFVNRYSVRSSQHFMLESLEPRLLLSATPTDAALDTVTLDAATAESTVIMTDTLSTSEQSTPTVTELWGDQPMSFEANVGQTGESVAFVSRGPGYTLFLTSTEAVFSLSTGVPTDPASSDPLTSDSTSAGRETAVLRLTLEEANPTATITGQDLLPGVVNYVMGSDSAQWFTDVETYQKVQYQGLYEGIDLVFYGNLGQLEYDWIVAPEADAGQIRLGVTGAETVELDESGNLTVTLASGAVTINKPVAYQVLDGTRVDVAASYQLSTDETGQTIASLAVGDYDATQLLVIDPVLVYSTYLGGNADDYAEGIGVDGSGAVYVTGYTTSTDFSMLNASQGALAGSFDAFVTKLDANGTYVYSTYLGGSGNDFGQGIAVDGNGAAYVTGITSSTDFPMLNASQGTNAGWLDVFVTKLDANGARVYSTYLGGSNDDQAVGIAVDGSGAVYVTGATNSTDFPTLNASQGALGNVFGDFVYDAFVTKLDANGARVYSTYLGGSGNDLGYRIAVDGSGAAYVTGETTSTDFPTVNASQGVLGNVSAVDVYDAFVTKLDANGAYAYSTYLGGSGSDSAFGIAVDESGQVYVTGKTSSTDFPTLNASQGALAGSSDAFVTKLDGASARVYSTYLGGSGDDSGYAIAVDGSGAAYVTGETSSTDFPTLNASQGALAGSYDVFVSKLLPSADAIVVTNVDDSGLGSLRQAIEDANNNPGLDVITFNIAGAGVHTIAPLSALPAITDAVIIDGYTQPGTSVNTLEQGSNAVLLIELNGENAGSNGLYLPTSNSIVRGLVLNGFEGQGVVIEGSTNVIEGNFIGTDPTGTIAVLNMSGGSSGVRIVAGNQNLIGGTSLAARNLISGNGSDGILIEHAGTDNNLVQGNLIGTNAAGTAAIANSRFGVFVFNGPNGNLIGGATIAERNVISGNAWSGISISANGVVGSTNGNVITGNYIGTDVTGGAALVNVQNGILVNAPNTIVGGLTGTLGAPNPGTGLGNVIVASTTIAQAGVFVYGVGTDHTTIQGNLIGLAADGDTSLGGGSTGIAITGGIGAQIGGSDAQARNIISGNLVGISISGSGSNLGTVIEGNYIGLDRTGVNDRGNSNTGIIVGNAPGTRIGGLTGTAGAPSPGKGSGNVISGNNTGVSVTNNGTGVLIQGNVIGLNVNGVAPLGGVSGTGVNLSGIGTTVGGTDPHARNVISGNAVNGVSIGGAGATGNQVQGNYIGTDLTGLLDRGNLQNGVLLANGASNNTIGGKPLEAGNVIAFNQGAGVRVEGVASTGNAITGNSIFGNSGLGIDLVGTAGVVEPIDDDDLDVGPNQLQNVPQLVLVTTGLETTISGFLESAPNSSFIIEFFANATGTVASAEAQTFLTRINVTTDANGIATFKETLPSIVPIGHVVTATATDSPGNTSEISTGVVAAVPTYPLTVTLTGLGSGHVTSIPAGIDSQPPLGPPDLSESYPINTLVTLTATPDAGSFFLGWTGSGINSIVPDLSIPMDQAWTVTANFGLTDTEPVAPVPTGNLATSVWSGSVTTTWEQPVIPPELTLLGYLVYVSLEDGVFTDPPIFVPPTETSLTLVNRPIVPHYFTVSTLTTVSAIAPGAELQSSALIEPAAAIGGADFYAIQQGGQFQTISTTGVLANDTGVNLVAGFATPPQHGALVFNPDGTFLYQHNGDGAASDSFTYRVDEGTVTASSPQVTVTITIAQESGQSQTASATPNAGLQGWTVQDETAEGGASAWNGIDPTYEQTALTGDPAVTVLKPGTDLIQNDGLPDGRIDYTLEFTIQSNYDGALGVMFRYLDAQNYYRFSMFDGEGGQVPYFRLIKVTQGVVTTLWEQLPASAYVAGLPYSLTIKADDLPQAQPTDPIHTDLVVLLKDLEGSQPVVDRAITDIQSLNAPLRTNGLALYSSRNPGSTYNLLSITGLDNSSQRTLEVGQNGSGVGIVSGTVVDNTQPGGVREVLLTPGAPVTSLAPNTVVTLTATPQVGGDFGGWTGAVTVPDPINAPHVAQVVLDQAVGQTKLVTATFTGAPVPVINMDVDGNQQISALTDGVLLVRYLFGVRGDALTQGALGQNATRTAAGIVVYLDQAKTTMLDVDGNGSASALTDGVLWVRYLFGVRGDALIQDALGQNAHPARDEFGEIEAYLSGFMQVTPTALTTTVSSEMSVSESTASVNEQLSAGDDQVSGVSSTSTASASMESSTLSIQDAAGVSTTTSSQMDVTEGGRANKGLAVSSYKSLPTSVNLPSVSSAVAATQLFTASVRSQPWVADFLNAQEDEEVMITL